jgi:hypothetical protein
MVQKYSSEAHGDYTAFIIHIIILLYNETFWKRSTKGGKKIMTAVPLQYRNDSKSNNVCYNNNIIVLAN